MCKVPVTGGNSDQVRKQKEINSKNCPGERTIISWCCCCWCRCWCCWCICWHCCIDAGYARYTLIITTQINIPSTWPHSSFCAYHADPCNHALILMMQLVAMNHHFTGKPVGLPPKVKLSFITRHHESVMPISYLVITTVEFLYIPRKDDQLIWNHVCVCRMLLHPSNDTFTDLTQFPCCRSWPILHGLA